MILKNKTLDLVNNSGSCEIVTDARRTIALLEDVTGFINFTADVSKCKIGDELVLIIKQGSGGSDLQLKFTNTEFVFSSCSDVNQVGGEENDYDIQFNADNNRRWVGHFFFDGSKYLNTAEDC